MKYISTGEAARLCGVGINTVKRWIQKGELKCVITPGGHWRIIERDFRSFLKTHDITPLLPRPSRRHKVLLIEDDPAMCSLVEGALELSSFDIQYDYANDGYTGLMKIGCMQPDLLILDIMLPEINGLELIHRIRKSGICCDPRIMVITGAGDRTVVKRGLDKAAPDAALFKPFATNELITCVEQQLSSKPLRRSRSL
ncbi:MAG: hypothetical protein AUJ57_05610 [Zetaproteobacteria bacterium CG1_02_53_45]|nr:MAG: hypothetical protein AUJ57_05610 [Zetaproteobacteria bacterium CG1_02_53_45]